MNKKQQFSSAVKAKRGRVLKMADGGTVPGAGPTTVNGGSLANSLAGFFTPQNQYVAQLAPMTNVNYTGKASDAYEQARVGYGQYNTNLDAGKALQDQLMLQSAGGGPNPAQAALAANTGNNVAQQAALAAGVRGASANAGLVARQVGHQGAQIQQNAVGQAATLQAQQQLAAQQLAAGVQGQLGTQITGEQGVNANLYGTSVNATNAQNLANVSNYKQAQDANAYIAGANASGAQDTFGGILGSLGTVGAAAGSLIKGAPDGNITSDVSSGGLGGDAPSSAAGQALTEAGTQTQGPGPVNLGGPQGNWMNGPAGNIPLTAAKGKVVPGKAKVKGDSLKNDTVKAMLSPGEIVLPRSIATHPDAPAQAAEFVRAIQAKQGLRKRGKK